MSKENKTEIKSQINYQMKAGFLSLFVLGICYYFQSLRMSRYFQVGDLSIHPQPVAWLGISSEETWRTLTIGLGGTISLVTLLLTLYTSRRHGISFLRSFKKNLIWILLFSITNTITEEVLFRWALVALGIAFFPPLQVALLSSLLFGLAHWKGFPGGASGMVLAGFLGFMLAKSVLETQGLLVAFSLHFIQDLLIFPLILETKK